MINIVASRYAEALFQVGEETDSTDKLYGELKAVAPASLPTGSCPV